ncbi:MAG: T9SS type A sorting domain-containing protein [Dysgonamonadaceae bacterium]|nr:T9SS type A sorting domain-containing protein [Dysgonamonadaceae bacterium]
MRNKKIILGTILAALMCAGTATRADDVPQLTVQWNFTDNSGKAYSFAAWRKITFDSDGKAVFSLTDGDTQTYSLNDVKSITFPVQALETSIPEITAAKLTAYPNPVTSDLTIEAENPLGTIILADLSGRRVKSLESKETKVSLNLSDLPKGIYILKAAGKTSKIIKN